MKWFAFCWMLAILAWGGHVGAPSLAPVLMVQAVLSRATALLEAEHADRP